MIIFQNKKGKCTQQCIRSLISSMFEINSWKIMLIYYKEGQPHSGIVNLSLFWLLCLDSFIYLFTDIF